MTGTSTPKRPLEVDEQDFSSEGHRWKRLQHDASPSLSVSASRSSSRSSYTGSSSVRILSDGVQHMVVDHEKVAVEAPQRNHLLPLAGLQPRGTSDYLLPQVSPSTLKDGIGSRKTEQICFGMGNSITLAQLRNVQVRINPMQSKDLNLLKELERDEDVLASLDLVFGQDRCDLQFKSITVATMNSKFQRALHQSMSVFSKGSVRFEGLVPRAEFKQKLEAAAQRLNADRSNLICLINVQIFGARYLAETIAKELCQHRMFLQHPIRVSLDIAYENPQYLSAVGSSFMNWAVLPPITAEASQHDIESTSDIEEPDQDPVDLKVS